MKMLRNFRKIPTRLFKENRGFILFVLLMLVFRSTIADWNEVPTGSMKPTILEGDRIWVNKMAYDIRIPFTLISLSKIADPKHGDIVIFDSKVSDKRLVKRVVALPGDIIEMRDNTLTINGKSLNYTTVSQEHIIEDLLGQNHLIRIDRPGYQASNFPQIQVPKDHYFVLGDNRNNSADSRFIGFVPRNEIVGRSRSVVLSFNYENFYIPRSNRFFHTL